MLYFLYISFCEHCEDDHECLHQDALAFVSKLGLELYRLARPRARWYKLGGHPLVGSERGWSQCKSSLWLSHGEVTCHRPWTFPFVSQDLKSSQQTQTVTIGLPNKIYPTLLCTVETPMIRPQRSRITFFDILNRGTTESNRQADTHPYTTAACAAVCSRHDHAAGRGMCSVIGTDTNRKMRRQSLGCGRS